MNQLPFPQALTPLAAMRRWVLWAWILKTDRQGKPRDPSKKSSWDKPPRLANGALARTDHDEDLSIYAEVAAVLAADQGRNFHGAGFAPRAADGLLFIDLDECRIPETGDIMPWALAIVEACNSYTEISPSQRGLRIIGLAQGWTGQPTKANYELPPEEGGGAGEIYAGSNYVTVSFNRLLQAPDQLAPIGEAANRIMARSILGHRGTTGAIGGHGGDAVVAPVEVVRETLALIPNEVANWRYWKERIGFAIFAATLGSDEGYLAWDEWSQKCPDYGAARTCEEEWQRMLASPPTRTGGYSVLHEEAKKAEQTAGRGWIGGPLWREWKAREAGITALPAMGEIMTPAAASDGGSEALPTIQVVQGQLSAVADAAENALIQTGFPVYTRAHKLVSPGYHSVVVRGGGNALVAGLYPLDTAALRDLLCKAAIWVKWDGRTQRPVRCDPPKDVVEVILSRIEPRPFPEVSAIVSIPCIRPDGSLSNAAGYDTEFGVHRVHDPYLRYPEGWGERPVVKADAEVALKRLNDLLEGFPFVAEIDRAVALSLLLSAVLRISVPVAPAFAVTATAAGSGKSHLIDLAAMISTGRRCPAAGVAEAPAETEKRLGGLVVEGYPIVSLDNVNGILRSDLLSQAVERERLQIRLLGSSSIYEVESRALFTVNGNGLKVSGDMVRRTLECRLDAGVERPEIRKFDFDPLRQVGAARGTYVAAALDVLRAYAAAGSPGVESLLPLGSYEEWSRHVRGALVWLGWPDPAGTIERARTDDPDILLFRNMLTAWGRRVGMDKPVSIREAIDMAVASSSAPGGEDSSARTDLYDSMLRAAGNRGVIDPQRLQVWLARNGGRIGGGMRFVQSGAENPNQGIRWKVERIKPDLRVVSNN